MIFRINLMPESFRATYRRLMQVEYEAAQHFKILLQKGGSVIMKRGSEVGLLQRYRRDRHELLKYVLSVGVIKKVVMQPGTISLDDVDLDQVSVDYVLECAKNGRDLDLSEAIKKYYDDLSFPPTVLPDSID
eukprot:Gb_32951 [translate_table: standard]